MKLEGDDREISDVRIIQNGKKAADSENCFFKD